MASWMYLPALLVWAWLAGGVHATSCANCEEKEDSVLCVQSADGEEYQIEVLTDGGVLKLRCESSTRTLNFSSIENCSFPSVELIEVYGCPLPNVSFGEVFLQMGVYLENITAFGFFDRNERDQQLEGWHLDGLVSLLTLEFVDNDFLDIPADLFAPTPNLRTIKFVSDSFNTLPETLFFNTLDLENLDFESNRLETLPAVLFANLSALANVSLSHNYISEIPLDFFGDNVNLENLNLSHNHLSYFERDVFRDLKALKNLSLQGNLLGGLPDGVFSDLVNLENLDLSINSLEAVPEKTFVKLRKVKKINLSNNSLGELPNEVFMECRSLESLSLRHNNLRKLQTRMFPPPNTSSLTYLDLGHNNISFAVKSSKILEDQFITYEDNFPLATQTQIQEILLNDNNIHSIPHAFNRVFVNLVSIDLSGNEIQYVSFHSLLFLQDSVTVNLRNNNLKLIDFHDLYPIDKEKEVKMYLEGNNLDCDCRLYRFTQLLQGKPISVIDDKLTIVVEDIDKVTCRNHGGDLEVLPEVDTRLLTCPTPNEQCIKNCSCVWRPDDKMFIVNCSFQGLQELPDLSELLNISVTLDLKNNSLTSLKGLQDPQYTRIVNLTVSNNKISFINESDIPATLKILDVRGNNLTSLQESLLNVFNATDMTLSFGGNPWICDCDLIHFLSFLHVPLRKVMDFEDIRCLEGGDPLLDLAEYSLCPFFLQPMVIITLVAIGAFLLLFAVLGTVSFYKYKQGIKVWLYAHRMCLWAVTEDEMDADKKFDAFISYSHKDEEFVNAVLVPGLESGDPKYRICLHYRDWVPGEYIQNQILQSVEASRRTIVVLSSNFIESVWGQLEFKAAHSQALQDRTNRIIVIVYGEVPPESELDEKLKLYIATKTYLKWGDAKFWEKLRYTMPHPPKKLNN